MGGFGNQLFQIAFALEHYKSYEIDVESTFGSPRKNRFGKAEIWSYQIPSRLSEVNTSRNRVVNKCLNFTLIRFLREFESPYSKFANKLILKVTEIATSIYFKRNVHLVLSSNVGYGLLTKRTATNRDLIVGYFQSPKWFSEETLIEMRKIEPIDTFREIDKLVAEAHIQKPIIVHVRLGDYEQESGIGILPFDYYNNGLTQLTAQLPDSEVWLFSNNIEKAKRIFSSWGGKEIRFIEDNWNSTSITFEAMRLGYGYLIANSTFSYWAALLSRNLNPPVISPRPWFLNAPSPRNIVPNNWIVIDSK